LGADGIIQQCLLVCERPTILIEADEGVFGGNYVGKAEI